MCSLEDWKVVEECNDTDHPCGVVEILEEEV